VLAVILSHAGFTAFSGGFVGVDVFFVISGFLITAILVQELEAGKFSILKFYERRARRILPALFIVLFITVLLAWIFLSRIDLINFSKSVTAVSFFVSNIFFKNDGGYFETASTLKPLLHTWSLAVEEQYYVLFPIILFFLWKLGRRWVILSLVLIAAISLGVAEYNAIHDPTKAFYVLPTRAWELAVGALLLLSQAEGHNVGASSNIMRQFLSIVGLALILSAVFLFDKNTTFPGVHALVPVIGAALLIGCAQPDTAVGKLLGSKFLVLIGLISYSAYLWHNPLFAFARYSQAQVSNVVMLMLSAASLVLAFFSWKYIERPFRNRQFLSRVAIFKLSAVGSFFFVVIGVTSAGALNDSSFGGSESDLAQMLTKHSAVYGCNLDERKLVKYRIQYSNKPVQTLVLGSSRVLLIGNSNLGQGVMNLGMSGATVEDDVAVAGLAFEKYDPRLILIGADPWLFNSNSGQDRWKSLQDEYHYALMALQGGKNYASRSQTSSFSEKDDVLSFLWPSQILNKMYQSVNIANEYAEDDTPALRDKIRSDGSHVYNTVFAAHSKQEIERSFEPLLNYSMSKYVFSNEKHDIFKKLVLRCRDFGEVVLVLTPYHPKLYSKMQQRKEFLDSENRFRLLAETTGARIIGSYDPSVVGCSEDDFYDGMHPKEKCMDHVISILLSD